MSVLTDSMQTVITALQNDSNVLEIKYEPEYSYTLYKGKVSKETLGYKLVVKYKE
jgi:hypothetical protein